MRRGVLPIVGSRIVGVEFVKSAYRPIRIAPRRDAFRRRAVDRCITDVGRVGKRVVIHLQDDHAIVLEPRMTGLVLLTDPPDWEHLRFGLKLARGPARWMWFWDRRGLGTVRLLSASQLRDELGPGRLGPDALTVSLQDLRDRLRTSRRAIKVALLDQAAIAGIGNLYASEILHLARIHPQQQCEATSAPQWERLHAAMRNILEEAIRYEGSTLSDGTYRNALNQQGQYQNHHRVYGSAGESCPHCRRGRIRRIVQSQRSTFFCPVCQRARRV